MTTSANRTMSTAPALTPSTSAPANASADASSSLPLSHLQNESGQLRKTAEVKLATLAANPALELADPLMHELRVHQIELEMQNEALHEAQVFLEESRDRYVDLFEMAPIGYLTLSVSGMIDEVNLSGARLLNEPRQTLLHKRFAHYVVPADLNAWHTFWQQALQHDGRHRGEIDLKGKDGTVTTVRLQCSAIRSTGRLMGVRLMLTDISDLKKALADTQTREDRLQLAKAASGLGLFDDQLLGGPHLLDDRFREIWGFTPKQPISFHDIVAAIHPDDRHGMQTALARAVNPRGDGRYFARYRVINQISGATHFVAAVGRVYFSNGQAVRMIGTVKDITEHTQLEQEVQARRSAMDLLARQQVASHTAAAIAHEINQPLTSVSAFSEAALHMLQEGVTQPQKLTRALEGAVQQAQRAGHALHELLEFLHRSETTTERLDLNQVVAQALTLTHEGSCSGFTVVFEQAPALPPVQANRLQVQKVVVNLVHNACEAMHSAGITGAAVKIRVAVHPMSDIPMAQVSVVDSGPGFNTDDAKRAFTPFFTTKSNGIGLGLAISRALIEANGGQLWLDPAPGTGAALYFSLPFAS